MRIKIFGIALIILFVMLVVGLFRIQVLQGWHFSKLSDKNCIRLLPQSGSRGRILDRDGRLIAGSKLYYDVTIMPQDPSQLEKTLHGIAATLGRSYEELKKKFNSNYTGAFSSVAVAENIDIKKALALEELKSEFEGIVISPRPARFYPYGSLACHLLGYLNEIDHWRLTKLEDYGYQTRDIVGFGGLEERYDYYLRQEEGGLSVEVDHRGRFMRVLGFKPPRNGLDIRLTIDLRIQKIVDEVLAGRKGGVVIMDPFTGGIIAMASGPNFNPGIFVRDKDPVKQAVLVDRNAPLINRVISGGYPAGSVFKAIIAVCGLETGKINGRSTFVCTGGANVGRQEFACWSTHGPQNLIQAITHSCNVFFYRTGLLVGPQMIHDYSVKFGLGKATGIDLPYESGGVIPNPLWKKMVRLQHWFDGDTANFSIGQGDVLVTPLQIAKMMAVFANNGKLVNPYVVQSVAGADVSSNRRKVVKVSIRPGIMEQVRKGLRGVVSEDTGTANVISTAGVSVAGKTGTAQAPPGQPHAWFAGFFPFDKPQFVICVFLEHGGPGYVSSVLARDIILRMAQEGLITN